ncbi:ATPase synthesis protein 25, mitochondrial [Lachnellula hyalina]|uniref:ATPase synthesis protein 25 n=1 Tax=Lachnellula hyalina TaxID=1316788 RepID=A0A8H8R805_9HELO|nr:ATPase synthesis protein 25, mitochondrial [Lachnellula hyalina]TVY30240.1 ATPase synthesis protein 25, mitochondrial [Lachnellula hyalina]
MVVGRVLRSSGCASCRLLLLRGFTSVAGPSLRVPYISTRLPLRLAAKQSLFYSSLENRQQDELENNEQEPVAEEIEEIEELEELEAQEEPGETTEVSAVPWYLQVQSPQSEVKPLSERQRIPELPESPPPILQPLLQKVSIDFGMDDLTLLDLRKLDPPPALGANLFMIIGTARSERHLHVSADRLCRWLRSTYKLRPSADGLLGRNEMKLKLRRKAKRAKLMGTTDGTEDDGIRTGWVCVDVGVVEGAEGEADDVPEPQDFVGFGRKTDGVRVVVQMLTEEKRQEIELERLWGGILNRSTQAQLEGDEDSAVESTTSQQSLLEPTGSAPTSDNRASLSGARGFHTFARPLPTSVAKYRRDFTTTAFRPSEQEALQEVDPTMLREFIIHFISEGQFEKALAAIQNSSNIPELQNGQWRPFMLEQLLSKIQSVQKEQAFEYLGTGSSDYSSTPFLTCFYQSLSGYPTPSEVQARVWLHCFARALGHPGYSRSGLLELFDEFKICGAKISEKTYMHLIRGVLQATAADHQYHGPPQKAIEGVMDMLNTMHSQGFTILDEAILLELQTLVSPGLNLDVPSQQIYSDPIETFDLPSYPMSPIQYRLHKLMMAIDRPCYKNESQVRLMDIYSRQRNWREFWEVWSMAPRQRKARTSVMYAFMFSRVAQAKNKKACMNVLRTWTAEMQNEKPPVQLGGVVAEAVRACLMVVDPMVAERAAENPDAPGVVIPLWVKAGGLSETEG